jgi:hypothetical protein
MTEPGDQRPQPVGEDLVGAERDGLRPGRRNLILGALVVLAAAAVAFALLQGDDPAARPRQLAEGGDLGAITDPSSLSEQLAPELGPGSDEGAEPIERPRCADSDSALPEGNASLVYTAKLTYEGTPAVVLGYRMKADNLQRLLLVMAEDDCRVLVTQSF